MKSDFFSVSGSWFQVLLVTGCLLFSACKSDKKGEIQTITGKVEVKATKVDVFSKNYDDSPNQYVQLAEGTATLTPLEGTWKVKASMAVQNKELTRGAEIRIFNTKGDTLVLQSIGTLTEGGSFTGTEQILRGSGRFANSSGEFNCQGTQTQEGSTFEFTGNIIEKTVEK